MENSVAVPNQIHRTLGYDMQFFPLRYPRNAPMTTIRLPAAVLAFCKAHNYLQQHFVSTGLRFTLDGKLVGDIGEAMAAESFDLILCARRTKGVDAHTRDGRSVQVKATGRAKSGPAFTPGEGVADYLLFLRIDFSAGSAEVAYNGPEAVIRKMLPPSWSGTKVVSLAKLLAANEQIEDHQRLKRVRA
jgi:hypothetical protein